MTSCTIISDQSETANTSEEVDPDEREQQHAAHSVVHSVEDEVDEKEDEGEVDDEEEEDGVLHISVNHTQTSYYKTLSFEDNQGDPVSALIDFESHLP